MIDLSSLVPHPDWHVALRGCFEIPQSSCVKLLSYGASWYEVRLDGQFLHHGPLRYEASYPQYQAQQLDMSEGKHCLAVHLVHYGVATRILENLPAGLDCQLRLEDNTTIPIRWRYCVLKGYLSLVRRINPQLGWVEWCDTSKNPDGWETVDFDDQSWTEIEDTAPTSGTSSSKGFSLPTISSLAPLRYSQHQLQGCANGRYAEFYGYELDDPPLRFMLRDLAAQQWPADGIWRRYDLGRIRLGTPRLKLNLPAGAMVEMGMTEYLWQDRVAPYIFPSAGLSANLDHYRARGGEQVFQPVTPKGGRWLEVHIEAPENQVEFLEETFIEREYHGDPEGSFECSDPQLNTIWRVGVETYRACCEDALIDNYTRERGEWLGDVASIGMAIGATAYSDLGLIRRGLKRAAEGARSDGLVPGMTTGEKVYMGSYAAQWVTAALDYVRLTGDCELLQELQGAAARNLMALEQFVTADGLTDGAGWTFIDWGYFRNPGPVDIALNLHYLIALRSFCTWLEILEEGEALPDWQTRAAKIEAVVCDYLKPYLASTPADWKTIGYHRATLAMIAGLIPREQQSDCLDYLEQHMTNSFPNCPTAPRLANPAFVDPQIITPYFGHYVFPLLIERGRMDFVLKQYRRCWGWMLEQNDRTWLEVFDTRWSHCHQWSGCPSWQLSRYVLGLHPRFDLAPNRYELKLIPGSLEEARGDIPLPCMENRGLTVSWQRQGENIHYCLDPRGAEVELFWQTENASVENLCCRSKLEIFLTMGTNGQLYPTRN